MNNLNFGLPAQKSLSAQILPARTSRLMVLACQTFLLKYAWKAPNGLDQPKASRKRLFKLDLKESLIYVDGK